MSDLVYSTEHGKMCPVCGKPEKSCVCKNAKLTKVNDTDGFVRVGRETKGRSGKGVTVITGIPLNEIELKFLAKDLKTKCGVGGTVKDGVIEIQGDQRDLLVEELAKRGYKTKRVGG